MPLILLTTFFGVLVVIAGWEVHPGQSEPVHGRIPDHGRPDGWCVSALDALLFYAFFEAMLIPMFLVIGMWGGPRRVYATIKFFLYTFLGSVFMLIGLIYLYIQSGSLVDSRMAPVPLEPWGCRNGCSWGSWRRSR